MSSGLQSFVNTRSTAPPQSSQQTKGGSKPTMNRAEAAKLKIGPSDTPPKKPEHDQGRRATSMSLPDGRDLFNGSNDGFSDVDGSTTNGSQNQPVIESARDLHLRSIPRDGHSRGVDGNAQPHGNGHGKFSARRLEEGHGHDNASNGFNYAPHDRSRKSIAHTSVPKVPQEAGGGGLFGRQMSVDPAGAPPRHPASFFTKYQQSDLASYPSTTDGDAVSVTASNEASTPAPQPKNTLRRSSRRTKSPGSESDLQPLQSSVQQPQNSTSRPTNIRGASYQGLPPQRPESVISQNTNGQMHETSQDSAMNDNSPLQDRSIKSRDALKRPLPNAYDDEQYMSPDLTEHDLHNLHLNEHGPDLQSLDHPIPQLYQMPFTALQNEPFDQESSEDVMGSELYGKPLSDQVTMLIGMPAKEQSQFFKSLSLTDWSQAGQQITAQLSTITQQISERRTVRRDTAKHFESEIAKRYNNVCVERDGVEDILKEMNTKGKALLHGANQIPSRTSTPIRLRRVSSNKTTGTHNSGEKTG